MTEAQKQAIESAYSELVWTYKAYVAGEILNHDWEAHLQAICDLESFEFIEPADLPEVNEED